MRTSLWLLAALLKAGPAVAGLMEGLAADTTTTAPVVVSAKETSEVNLLKNLIREDLLAVRRARYALKRARERSDETGMPLAQGKLLQAKSRLKKHRTLLRAALKQR